MKTILQWYDNLDSDIREKAIFNYNKYQDEQKTNRTISEHEKIVSQPMCDLSEAINAGFQWNETPEGESYWQELYDDYYGSGEDDDSDNDENDNDNE